MTPLTHRDVIEGWVAAADRDDRAAAIHPTGTDPDAYWSSGAVAAHEIHDRLPVDQYPVVGDFGAGDGRVAIPLAQLDDARQVVAVDAVTAMIQALMARAGELGVDNIDGVLADGITAEFTLPEVDAWYTLACLIHHSYDDGARILAAMAASLRPGGVILLDVPVYDQPRERDSWTDVTVWDAAQFHKAAEAAGLVVLEGWHNDGTFSYSAIGPNHGRLHVLRKPDTGPTAAVDEIPPPFETPEPDPETTQIDVPADGTMSDAVATSDASADYGQPATEAADVIADTGA